MQTALHAMEERAVQKELTENRLILDIENLEIGRGSADTT